MNVNEYHCSTPILITNPVYIGTSLTSTEAQM